MIFSPYILPIRHFLNSGTTSVMPDEPEILTPTRRLWQRRRHWMAIRCMGRQ
jgi:hypothetical protein